MIRTAAIAVLSLGVLAGAFLAWDAATTGDIETGPYDPVPLDVATDNIIDIGVADITGDGRLDLFTSAHNHRQSILPGAPGTGFGADVADSLLPQDAAFPGLELTDSPPDFTDPPRVALYWHNLDLVVRAWGALDDPLILRFESAVRVPDTEGWEVRVDTADGTTLRLRPTTPGTLRMTPRLIAVPIQVRLPESTPLDAVAVGGREIAPTARSFSITLRDRHGMAWADVDADGDLDVFIGRGGLQGRMGDFAGDFSDELLIQEAGRFVRADSPGFEKGECPAYQAGWTDADADGDLDLYVGCQRGRPNQLYLGSGGGFTEAADSFGLAIEANEFHSQFLWFDPDLDGDLDLLLEDAGDLVLFTNGRGSFERAVVRADAGPIAHFALADYDGNGYPDLYAASRNRSILLVNHEGRLEPVDPDGAGLPGRALTATWLDADADGRPDLLTLPGGIHRQQPDGTFEPTGELATANSRSMAEARVHVLDADGDGGLDVVTGVLWDYSIGGELRARATGRYEPLWGRYPQDWRVDLYRGPPGRTLQLELRGPPGNPHALGAYVDVVTDDWTRRLFVGESESSHHSQGHYRLYAPLRPQDSVREVRVTWPDGQRQTVAAEPGELVVVRKSE